MGIVDTKKRNCGNNENFKTSVNYIFANLAGNEMHR